MTTFTGIEKIDLLLASAEPKTNDRGNTVRHFLINADRYILDFNLPRPPWRGFDAEADAWYFGNWFDKEGLKLVSYVEGDVYFTQCVDKESFDAEMAALCESQPPGASFSTIGDGVVTRFFQDRREFFHDPLKCPASSVLSDDVDAVDGASTEDVE